MRDTNASVTISRGSCGSRDSASSTSTASPRRYRLRAATRTTSESHASRSAARGEPRGGAYLNAASARRSRTSSALRIDGRRGAVAETTSERKAGSAGKPSSESAQRLLDNASGLAVESNERKRSAARKSQPAGRRSGRVGVGGSVDGGAEPGSCGVSCGGRAGGSAASAASVAPCGASCASAVSRFASAVALNVGSFSVTSERNSRRKSCLMMRLSTVNACAVVARSWSSNIGSLE
mmetsp:Transcript_29735/g.88023  ORF Transcript_29735/g.88023 Transcript_29735/m.88023 type:complete len:237 (-) Transcript_29735:647-1357(-)